VTTKGKIILGFGILNIIVLGLGLFGYLNVDKASTDFGEYRRHAEMTATTGDMATAVSNILLDFNRFLALGDPKWVDAAVKEADRLTGSLAEGRKATRIEARERFFDGMARRVDEMRGMLLESRKARGELRSLYEIRMRPACRDIYGKLDSLTKTARGVGNVQVLAILNDMWHATALYATSLGRFYGTLAMEDIREAADRLGPMGERMERIGPLLSTDAGRRDFQDIGDAYRTLTANTAAMLEETEQLAGIMERTTAVSDAIGRDLQTFGVEVHDLSRTVAAEIVATNDRAKSVMLSSAGGGLLLGCLFAVLIIAGFSRVVADLTRLSRAITDGDFSYRTGIREKGEIGIINASMGRIPEVLQGIMAAANAFADAIGNGRLNERMDASSLTGEYARLAEAVNTVGEAFVGILGQFPPFMACSEDCTILFLNGSAQKALGGDFCGGKCHDHLHAPECRTDKCLGRQCLTRGTFLQETRIAPQGNPMDVAVCSMPIVNRQGRKVGFYEFLTDISESKRRQRAIQEVTGQAMEISHRIAAASGELSAQVEQVSRGAEVQRARVESTASAMAEMNATVLEVAGNAARASEQSELSREKADEGATLVNRVVAAMNNVNQVSVRLQTNMGDLGRQAEAIGGVMGVISDIADQTNLLALNAAIEAARAGEAGRGFAVVADEVRKLAEKTMTATQEVGSNIGAIQHAARANVDAMEDAVRSVGEATELANRSGDALKDIVGMASLNSTVVTSIATAAEEQSATSEEINKALEEINGIVAETTDGMVQSSGAVQDLSRMAQELNAIMEKLK
jgi:methyl-accepting chemotaxis protein